MVETYDEVSLAQIAASVLTRCVVTASVCLQLDANKRREAELQKLRRDLEDSHAQNEAQVSALRKKQQDTINEMSEQLEQLQKLKQKYDIFCSNQLHCVAR